MKKIVLLIWFLSIFNFSFCNEINKVGIALKTTDLNVKQASNVLIKSISTINSNLEISTSELSKVDLLITLKINKNLNSVSDFEGFSILKVDSKNVEIIGKSARGLELGIYEYLEKIIGVTWLMPGELWTFYPKNIKSFFPNESITQEPSYLSRELSPLHIAKENSIEENWYRKNKFGGRIKFHHNFTTLFKNSNNSSFFVNKKKRGFIPNWKSNEQEWQIDFKSSETKKYSIDKIKKYFKAFPQSQSFSLGINDNTNFPVNLSGRKNSIMLDNYSEEYYKWVNDVVKGVRAEFPNKKFGLLAYLNVFDPPSFNLEKEVIPYITYESTILNEKGVNNFLFNNQKKWKAVSESYGIYDYVYGFSYLIPRSNFSLISTYIKKSYEIGAKHYYAEFYPGWIDGPKAWLIGKVTWNTSLDYSTLIDDWYLKAFGYSSSNCMKDFYSIWEQVWSEDLPKSQWWKKRWIYLKYADKSYLNDLNPSSYEKSLTLLNTAIELAKYPEEKARINFIKENFMFQRLYYYYYQKVKLPETGRVPNINDLQKLLKKSKFRK